MRYMYLVTSPASAGPPPQRLMEEIGKLTERVMKEGNVVDMGGLMPMAMGARVELRGGKIEVTDGPFVEAREFVGGYAIFDYASREEALASAVSFMELHRQYGEGWEGTCEMRPMADVGQCG